MISLLKSAHMVGAITNFLATVSENVLFVIDKISKIQRLIATKPDVPQQA